ncbi:hypothetical protein [Ruminococcus sp.]|uniref:hypothetical protein n=1 Tax=Ruminococcus sp. TaxID=41978 RepID=UPI0035216FAC
MLQFVDRDTYKNAIINPERAFLLYVDNENKISLQADIELGGDPVNYRVELMDFELDSTKPILLTTVECRGFYCGGIKFIEYGEEIDDTSELAINDFLKLSDEADYLLCKNYDLCRINKAVNDKYFYVCVL